MASLIQGALCGPNHRWMGSPTLPPLPGDPCNCGKRLFGEIPMTAEAAEAILEDYMWGIETQGGFVPALHVHIPE